MSDVFNEPLPPAAANCLVRRWPDVRTGEYWLHIWLDEVEGRYDIVGIDIRAAPDAGPVRITGSLLRELPMARLADEFRDAVRTGIAHRETQLSVPDWLRAQDARDVELVRRGRYDADHWREVAAIYDDAFHRGEHPTRAVAEHFGVPRSTAGKWVARCRDFGLLPTTAQRKAKGNDPPPETRGAQG